MAGMDKDYTGEAWLAQGATCGYLPQEPQLDPNKTAHENVMEGVASKTAILTQYNELMMDYNEENAEKASKLQDIIDAENLWDLEQQVEMAMDALGCPPPDSPVTNLSGGEKRRIALCKLLCRSLTFCCLTSRPTISTRKPCPGLKSICAPTPAPC
jgi:ATPase subunit of ABC transporter with duplicated ATPase domains